MISFLLLFSYVSNIYAYDFEVDGIYFNVLSPSTCEMTSGDNSYDENVEIPTTVRYKGRDLAVVALSNGCFGGSTIKSIEIGSNIKTIGQGVFNGCKSLIQVNICESVAIPESHRMFKDCHKLRKVHLPSSMESIGLNCFENCYNLETVDIPKKVKTIRENAFNNCMLIDNITIPGVCEVVEKSSFKNCISLYNFKIDDSQQPISINSLPPNIINIYIGKYFKPEINMYCSWEHVTFGKYITQIPATLSECRKIIDIKVMSDKLPTFPKSLDNKVVVNANLFVQKGLGAIVSSTMVWKDFWTVNEIDFNKCSNFIHVMNVGDGHVSINGFDVYNNPDVPIENGKCTINIKPDPNNVIDKVLLSGKDITSQIKNGKYSTTINENKCLKVYFMKSGSKVPPSAYVEVAGTKWARGNLVYDIYNNGDKNFAPNWRLIDNCNDYINCYSGRDVCSFVYDENRTEHFFYNKSNYNTDLIKNATNSNYRLPTSTEFSKLINNAYSHYSYIRNNDRLIFGYYFSDENLGRTSCRDGAYYTNAALLTEEDLEKGVFFPLIGMIYRNENTIVDCCVTGFYYGSKPDPHSNSYISYLYMNYTKDTGLSSQIIYKPHLGSDDVFIGPYPKFAFGAYGLRGVIDDNYNNTTSSVIQIKDGNNDNSYKIYDTNGIEHHDFIHGINIIKYRTGKTSKIFK